MYYYFFLCSITTDSQQVSFEVADALNQPFPDGKFDLVWSMESGEHMPEKAKVWEFYFALMLALIIFFVPVTVYLFCIFMLSFSLFLNL